MRVGSDGNITPVDAPLREQLGAQAAEYRLQRGPLDAYLMCRLGANGRPRGRLLMVGEVVSRMTIVEIINVITSTHWRGELHLLGPLGQRVLTIDQGALKHAQTSYESERLGELLVRNGLLERSRLLPLLKKQKSDQRFGQVLIQEGVLSEEDLYKQLHKQIEHIFYESLLEERGTYWFIAPAEELQAPAATVHLPVQILLMEGVQRIDEMGLYRERIPHNRVFPAATGNALSLKTGEALEPFMLEVLAACDGARDIDDLARHTAQGEFAVLKAIYHLSRAGSVQIRRGPTLDHNAARKLIRQFNDLVRDVFVVVATYKNMDAGRKALASWLETGPHAPVLGCKVDFDGTLDANEVLALLTNSMVEDPMMRLHQALHELAAYALFAASNGLPRHEEQALSRHVNQLLKQMRL